MPFLALLWLIQKYALTGRDFLSEEIYYQALFSIQSEMKSFDPEGKTRHWNKLFLSLNDPLTQQDLPLALSMVHPAFHFDWSGKEIILSEEGWGPRQHSGCEFAEISGVECPWNQDPDIRSTMNRDHRWPKSLGGPKSGFNLLWLCESHNLAKGNGVWGFDWKNMPLWLQQRLTELRKRKLLGIPQEY